MFTGIVRECGRLIEPPRPSEKGGVVLHIGHSVDLARRLEIGASLAVAGVCLTLVTLDELDDGETAVSTVELSPETLARTGLGDLDADAELNLEPALAAGDALGGHWVQGHVDGRLEVVDRRDLDEHRELSFELPDEHRAHVVEKGSVTLDGVSLTVSALAEDRFDVALIPHTLDATTLRHLKPGDRVHFEVDVLAKYVHRALDVAGVLAR